MILNFKWFLLNAIWVDIYLYHGWEQFKFQWDEDVSIVLDQQLYFYSASSLKQQSACRPVASLWHIILIPSQPVNTNLIFFGLTQPGLELTNYYTQGKYANHDTTNAVSYLLMSFYSKWNQTWLIFVTLNFSW